MLTFLGYASAILIGVLFGLFGAGGSILMVPVFVYLFRMEPTYATFQSLFIAALTSLFAAYRYFQNRNIDFFWGFFVLSGSTVGMALSRAAVLPAIPQSFLLSTSFDFSISRQMLIMSVFAVVLMAAALSMLSKSSDKVSATSIPEETLQDMSMQARQDKLKLLKIWIASFATGLIVGIVGTGGGFLLIPVLSRIAFVPLRTAMGTSLMIIFINGLTAVITEVVRGNRLNGVFVLVFLAISYVGVQIGVRLSQKMSADRLKRSFALFMVALAIFIFMKELLRSQIK